MCKADDTGTLLIQRLRGKRFGVVGIGNVLRGDDGAGCMLVELLQGRIDMPIVDCAEVPENYGGWVERRDLEAVVYVDAVDFGGEPGEARIIPLAKMMESATSTHHLSLHYMIRFLEEEWSGDAILVGVQPESMDLGDGLSESVAAGVRDLAGVLEEAASTEADR
jgi:hydrogenase 3 maturation protease